MKKKQGFASLTPERLKEVGKLGGTRSQELGKAYTFTSETGRDAGKKARRMDKIRKELVLEPEYEGPPIADYEDALLYSDNSAADEPEPSLEEPF